MLRTQYINPFFGAFDVANVNTKELVDFDKRRTEQLGCKAHHSTFNTHNTALNRVLDKAEQRGWMTLKTIKSFILLGFRCKTILV